MLAEAEIKIAQKFQEAAKIYSVNDIALLLKNLSILNEGLKAGNSMMLVPNSITEKLEGNDIFGLQALFSAFASLTSCRHLRKAAIKGPLHKITVMTPRTALTGR